MAAYAIAVALKKTFTKKTGEYTAVYVDGLTRRYLDPEMSFTEALIDAQLDARRNKRDIKQYYVVRSCGSQVRCF